MTRLVPSEDLAGFVEHFWLVEWELAGLPARQVETRPHPTQDVVIDPSGTTGIFGLQRAKFTHELSGSSRAGHEVPARGISGVLREASE